MILVLGSGVAGLTTAITAAAAGTEVTLVTPGQLQLGLRENQDHSQDPAESGRAAALWGGNTALAQGGIAAALGAADAPRLHAADTVVAGNGLVDSEAAALLCSDGAAAVRQLIADGFAADRSASGALSLGLEAAHGKPRIVHAGEDHTGSSLHSHLSRQLDAYVRSGLIRVIERSSVVALQREAGSVCGAVICNERGQRSSLRADAVVLATGGYAALYSETSNQARATGEGIVLAARLGAVVADLEFVQFHPTVLTGTGFLISEAVRGTGAVLRDGAGVRFMQSVHEAGELAPRDVVSRAVHRVLGERGDSTVWLDGTGIERTHGTGTLARRFPSITAATLRHGYDWSREPIPVTPAAHYSMGGIVTDLEGRTSLPGLFAVGEVANTGVHGANRLASNSLLEGLVFGARAAQAATVFTRTRRNGGGSWHLNGDAARRLMAEASPVPAGPTLAADARPDGLPLADPALEPNDALVREALSQGLGIERDAEGMRKAAKIAQAHAGFAAELVGMIASSASARRESRGAHQRADFPQTDVGQSVRTSWVFRGSTPNAASAPRRLDTRTSRVDRTEPQKVHAC